MFTATAAVIGFSIYLVAVSIVVAVVAGGSALGRRADEALRGHE